MKKLILIPALFCLFMLNVASMCSSDDDNSSTDDAVQVANIASQGTWRVSNFFDSGTDETSHFTGYNFTFGASNVVTATNGVNTYTGAWSVIPDDNSTGEDIDFNMSFVSPADFTDLTEDWDIVTFSSTQIALVHTSGGGGGTDALVLTKN